MHRHELATGPANFYLRVMQLLPTRLNIGSGGELLLAEGWLLVEQEGYPCTESTGVHLLAMRTVGLDNCRFCVGTAQVKDTQAMSVWELDSFHADIARLIDIVVLTRMLEWEEEKNPPV